MSGRGVFGMLFLVIGAILIWVAWTGREHQVAGALAPALATTGKPSSSAASGG